MTFAPVHQREGLFQQGQQSSLALTMAREAALAINHQPWQKSTREKAQKLICILPLGLETLFLQEDNKNK